MSDPVSRFPCPVCGESIAISAKICRFCNSPVAPVTNSASPSTAARSTGSRVWWFVGVLGVASVCAGLYVLKMKSDEYRQSLEAGRLEAEKRHEEWQKERDLQTPKSDDLGTPKNQSAGNLSPGAAEAALLRKAVDEGAITAEALYKEYQANELAAEVKYREKAIVVVGRIRQVSSALLGTPQVELEAGGIFVSVKCLFSKGNKADNERTLAALVKGQVVVVRGTCSRQMPTFLTECELLGR